MKPTEVHVRENEFFTLHVDPYYANKKYDLYYPKACPGVPEPEEVESRKCLMTPQALNELMSLDFGQIAQNLDIAKCDESRTLRYIKSLDVKLNSPQSDFLKKFQFSDPHAYDETNMLDAKGPCPLLNQQLKCGLLEKNGCHPAHTKESDPGGCCGKGCPSMSGHFENPPMRTFHVPDCPSDFFKMPLPRSPVQGAKACPFSPACCPIADVCPYPVNTVFDPSAPPLPPLEGPRRCLRLPIDYSSVCDPSRSLCPLDPLKKPTASPPGCPLVKSSSCHIGRQADCPLLTCSLGRLKTFIFDGNDECPFCHNKCCPMITPDGPGCPIMISGNVCPLSNTEVCALKGMSSPSQVSPASQPGEDEESRPSQKQCPMAKISGTNFNESCRMSNTFECPGLQRAALSKLFKKKASTSKLPKISTDQMQKEQSAEKKLEVTNPSKSKGKPTEAHNSPSKKSTKGRSSTPPRGSSNQALKQNLSTVTEKAENFTRKAVYDTTAMNTSTRKNMKSSNSSLFEVSLEPLPRPPLSEYENARNSFRKSSKWKPPKKEDRRLVRAALPDDSRGGAKACKTGMPLNAMQNHCTVETSGCSQFPKGHCPMDNINTCECEYPVSPCLEPVIPEDDGAVPDQYCSRLNCCMGLPLPPTKLSAEFETDTWYKFSEVLPGDKATKNYLEILNYPPQSEFLVSINKERKNSAWKIIKQGEGYKRCKKVKERLVQRGPVEDKATQFQLGDLPDDEEIRIIEKNRVNSQKAVESVLTSGLQPTGWTDILPAEKLHS